MSQDAIQRATDVKRRHEAELMRKANVIAVGIGFKTKGGKKSQQAAIIVSVKKKVPIAQLAAKDVIPSSIDGVPVDVIETGEIKAL